MGKQRVARTTSTDPYDRSTSRKQQRKERKIQKKEKKKQYFQNRHVEQWQLKPQKKQQKHNNKGQTKPVEVQKKEKKVTVQKKLQELQKLKLELKPSKKVKQVKEAKKIQKKASKKIVIEETEDDKMIRLYEQKLGMHEGKDKYNKIAKSFGMDDDIFDFLDNITKKTQKGHQQVEGEQDDQISEELEEMQGDQMDEEMEDAGQENEQFDEEFDQMFDNIDAVADIEEEEEVDEVEEGEDEQNGEEYDENEENDEQQFDQENENVEEQKPIKEKMVDFQKKEAAPSERRPLFGNGVQQEIRKGMNGLFNKLSDGNILLSFRQFMRIIEAHPRSTTVPIYSDLFLRFNILIEKPLFHILATNVALLAALHRAYGNRLLAPVLHAISKKYVQLSSEKDEEGQVQELGYSKRFERCKNYATIVSLLYNYGSVTSEFIQSLVQRLTNALDREALELLYIVIQKCGGRLRQNDPATLKEIITAVKAGIERFRTVHGNEQESMQKVNFIETQLTQIRFNKKAQLNSDQRMAFLQTFLTKNVPKEVDNELEPFLLPLSQLLAADTSRTNWWNDGHDEIQQEGYGEEQGEVVVQVARQKRALLQLAKSFHMVTEAKRNIFLCLMDSKDYLEATQRILELRVRNYQDVATVLVEVCTLQPTFNPFYPLVAAKLASLLPKFRLQLQYALWDRLKLLANFELRRTSNLAKFMGRLIADPQANCSLSLLKFYPDLSNLKPADATFVDIFLNHFFSRVKSDYLARLAAKLREDNNRSVKEGIKQLLGEFECPQKYKQKVKLLRRLLLIELDERKAERGDDLQ